MEILSASLCDYAADYNGKLCVMGVFDSIISRQFPTRHPQCFVAVRLLLRDEDIGVHLMQVHFIDPDGQLLIPTPELPRAEFEMKALPPEAYFLSKNFIFSYHGLPIPCPGQYEIQILLDGTVARTLPLQFVEAPRD